MFLIALLLNFTTHWAKTIHANIPCSPLCFLTQIPYIKRFFTIPRFLIGIRKTISQRCAQLQRINNLVTHCRVKIKRILINIVRAILHLVQDIKIRTGIVTSFIKPIRTIRVRGRYCTASMISIIHHVHILRRVFPFQRASVHACLNRESIKMSRQIHISRIAFIRLPLRGPSGIIVTDRSIIGYVFTTTGYADRVLVRERILSQ